MTLIMPNHWELLNKFDRRFTPPARDIPRGAGAVAAKWMPAVDILEQDDAVIIIADVAGVAPEKIDVSAEKHVLTIRGERPGESGEGNGAPDVIRRERQTGGFERSFHLSDALDLERISARCAHGLLEVRLPKRVESQPRSIPVTH